MRIDDFQKLFLEKPFFLDGASGTYLIHEGMPAGVCPEKWATEHSDIIQRMHREYIRAGAQAVYAFTFGANALKLREYGLEKEMRSINLALCEAACEAAQGRALVAGDMSPTGRFCEPLGDLPFEEAVQAYYDQALVLAQAGADFLVVETMLDVQEARAALIGIKEACSLPVAVSMTFDETGRTLTGSDAACAAGILSAAGADAIGANCGMGPQAMYEIIAEMRPYAKVPIFAKPNAGLPGGKSMEIAEYAVQTARLIQAGARGIGGCCGTTPEHIKALVKQVGAQTLMPYGERAGQPHLFSVQKRVAIGERFCKIGERINPTGKKKLQAALKEENVEYVLQLAVEQKMAGASVLDVNVGAPGVDETALLPKYVLEVAGRVDLPLCIDSANAQALERAVRVYPGRALMNSISAEPEKAEALLPIAKKYGAMFIALPLGEDGVPDKAEGRIRNIEAILEMAKKYGLGEQDMIVDALALSVASNPDGGKEALKVIEYCNKRGIHTIMGVSNISFGLPNRPQVNAAMLTCAMASGMRCAILNVCEPMMQQAAAAAEMILEGGESVSEFSRMFSETVEDSNMITDCILNGERERIKALVQEKLEEKAGPQEIIEKELIPALDRVGELFSEKKIFLPQLMASAEAAKEAFAYLEPFIRKEGIEAKATAVIATVKGDIHDIGKNIVGMMLKNHGFEVIDLGRDVPNEVIIEEAKKRNATVVGLSALITTTMPRMGECARLLREQQLKCALMVGGAVVTPEYAQEIGALYSKDAQQAVEVARAAARKRGFDL